MKKIFLAVYILITCLIGVLLATPVYALDGGETWTTIDLTSRFADEPLENYDLTRDSSSGWSYSYANIYSYKIKTKRIQLQVDKLTEVKVPRFFMNGTNAGTHALNDIEVDLLGAVYLRFYNTPESSTPVNSITLHGTTQDFTRLPDYEPIEVNPLQYIEIEYLLNFEFAQAIEFGVTAPSNPYNADLGVSWSWVNGSYKKAFDSIFYPLRGSFRNDIMALRYPNSNTTIYDSRSGDMETYTTFPVGYYKASIKGESLRPVEEIHEISDLPNTTGNIYSNPAAMGTAEVIDVDGFDIMLEIKYASETYHLEFTFDAETDMEMFEKAESHLGHYYTYESLKYVILYLDTGSMFNVSAQNMKNQKFVPYVIWNLDSNEFYRIDRTNVYVTVFQEAAHHVYAYFYVDQLVISNLLSATITMEWRYINMLNQASEWYPYAKVLSAYETSGPSASWEVQAATLSAAGFAFSLLLPPPANVLGIGIFGFGTIFTTYWMWENILTGENIFSGTVNEIQQAVGVPSDKLAQINLRYQQQNPNFTGVTETYKLWKLHLGQFNKFFEDHIEIKENTFKVMQFTYRTNGQLYTIEEDSIETIFDPGDLAYNPSIPEPQSVELALTISLLIGFGVLLVTAIGGRKIIFTNRGFNFPGLMQVLFGALVFGAVIGLISYFGINLLVDRVDIFNIFMSLRL